MTQPIPLIDAPAARVFVLCPAFHGATLLAVLLNNHSRVSSLGDTYPSRAYDQICSCGENVSACSFWNEVAVRTHSERFDDASHLLPTLPRVAASGRLRLFGSLILSGAACVFGPRAWRLSSAAAREFLTTTDAFERCVHEVHDTSVFVDGHKHLAHVAALATLTPRERPLKLIHLVRDPRGYANSCLKYGNPALAASARGWSRKHRAILTLIRVLRRARVLRVSYEDLCASPGPTLDGIFRFLDVAPEDVLGPPRDPSRHHLMGNHMLRTFDGKIRLDTKWQAALSATEQATALAAAGGLACRFGYR